MGIVKTIQSNIIKAFEKMKYNSIIPENIHNSTSNSSNGAVVAAAKRLGIRMGDLTSSDFEDPEYNLLDIDNAYSTDSYVRQCVDKIVEKIFKEGFGFYGKNPNAIEYIKIRLTYMAETTQQPLQSLLNDMAEDMVKYHNIVLVKSRKADESQMPPGVTVNGIDGTEPVAGYFCLHPGTMTVKRDSTGLIQSWKQEVDGSDTTVNFNPSEIVHIYYKRKKGNAFGEPFLLPVLDDIRALRFLEENVVNMVYKHTNPFFHITVGDDESPGSPQEVEEVRVEIENMDPAGGLVTNNRVTFNSVEADKAVDAKGYLEYLEARVFSGLGISAVQFGRGDTSNRNTADSMTDELSDRIKAFQQAIETGINFFIIKDLLIEGGFDPLNNPDDIVTFEFLENDLDRKIKAENHAIYKYEHNSITEDEMRDEIGKDPITDRSKMFQTLITQANATHESSLSSSSTTSSSSNKEQGTGETNNKNKPTNQHGTKTSSKKTTNSVIEQILKDNYKDVAQILNIPDYGAKTICAVLKDQINEDRLLDKVYIDNISDRINNLSKYFNNKE